MVSVGVIVNSASGHDVRRLVSAATVVDNSEKGAMAVRLMAGLGAAGVDEVLAMPLDDTVAGPMARVRRGIELETGAPLPPIRWLDMPVVGRAVDTCLALDLMRQAGVAAICVLGGDGTQRLAVGRIGDIPLMPLSTGTNNAFPGWSEATVAGLATGCVATGQVSREDACVQEHALLVHHDGRTEAALVDVAVTRSLFTGVRASWRAEHVEEVTAVFTDPTVIGLSAIVAARADAPRHAPVAARVRLGEGTRVRAPLAPGVVEEVAVSQPQYLRLGDVAEIPDGHGAISLDGERLIERPGGLGASMELVEALWRIDVARAMSATRVQRWGP